jgi:hypothetical protein
LFDDVFFGFAMFMVTTRRGKYRRVFGHVGHESPVAEGVRPEAGWAVGRRSGLGFGERGGGSGNDVERVGCERGIMGFVGIRGVCDDIANREARAEAWGVLLENNMDRCSDAAGLWVVDAIEWGFRRVANHDATKRFSLSLLRNLSGTLANTVHPKTRNMEASGADDVRRLSGTPPVRPTERL